MDFLTQQVPLWSLILAGVVIVILSICLFHASAPEGFEDSKGFHTYEDAYETIIQENAALEVENMKLKDTIAEMDKLCLENVDRINNFAHKNKIQLGIEKEEENIMKLSGGQIYFHRLPSKASEKLDKVIIQSENSLKEGIK